MERIDPAKVILIDKPLKWTSFDVVKKVRGHFKLKKVGHAGTLDPLATGLLVLCTGKKTKEIESYMGLEKEYTGTFILGKKTPSYDLETEIIEERDVSGLTVKEVEKAVDSFRGIISQKPPVYSAIRVKGKRAYESARKGKDIELRSREVEIRLYEVSVKLPEVRFRVICSKGTYIRSLARDLGEALGCGAYLSELRRVRIGDLLVEDAWSIEELVAHEDL